MSKYVIGGRDPRPGEAAVYVLRDPDTREVRYVGKTGQRLKRRMQNLWHYPTASAAEWIGSLDTPPHMETIMYLPVEQVLYWERVVIQGMLAEGAALVNAYQDGRGECGTNSGYAAHVRNGEPTCKPCKAARKAYRNT